MTGINKDVLFNYRDNNKTEFEIVCLFGFLSLKSIIGNKPYCKSTNNFWLSRMDGKSKCIKDKSELTPELQKYANEYQTRKIKNTLQNEWSLIYWSYHTRGFYISFSMTRKELAIRAAKKNPKIKENKRKQEAQEIIKELGLK